MQAVSNDSLRLKIITMYDVEYEKLEKVEEEYNQTQLFNNYHHPILKSLAPRIQFSETGRMLKIDLESPFEPERKQLLRGYFWHIRITRLYSIREYEQIIQRAEALIADIERELS